MFFGGIGQSNVTYRKNVALRCGCSVPVAKWLDSYAVGIAQLAHTVGEFILCREGGYVTRPKWLWGGLVFTQRPPFPFDDNHPHLIQPSLDRPHSSPKTSGSNQRFCHNTLCEQTDRPTDRWSRQMSRNMNCLRLLDSSDAANNDSNHVLTIAKSCCL